MEQGSKVSVEKGYIFVYRALDIAEEVDLAGVERLLKERSGMSRLRIQRSTRQAFHIKNAPIMIALGESPVRIGDRTFRAEAFAKIWEYGVLSVQFQIPIITGTVWGELVSLASQIEFDSNFDDVARGHSHELAKVLGPAMQGAHDWEGIEDYVIYFFEKLNGVDKPLDLAKVADVPALIVGEPNVTLSPRIRASVEENTFQYGNNDLAVVDWAAAIVIEPTGQRDVADVLEFAVTHLMEFRYYDDLLDQRLAVLYDSIDLRRGWLRNRFGKISHEASSRYIEFAEFIERVENSLKVVGDFYLAIIFRTATQRFRLRDWEESLTRKMNLLAQVSELLQGEVNVQRSHWLEIIIIALIAFEIVSALIQSVG